MKRLYKILNGSVFFIGLLIFSAHSGYSQRIEEAGTDSSKKESESKAHFKSTARFHNKGMFAYGGRVCSDDLAFDINFVYDRKKWGFFIYKAFDLVDHTSLNNFTLAVLYKSFKLTEKVTFTPHFGVFLEQPHSFAGHGSDFGAIGITAVKISSHLTIDHTALVGNLILEPEMLDWVNRFRVLYTNGHLDITSTVWHNNRVFDEGDYASSGLTIAYSRLKLSNTFNLNFAVTDLVMLRSSNEESVPKENNVVITVALQLVK